jgi:hypothetical protein
MCYVRISLLPGGRKALRIKDAGDSRVARKAISTLWEPAGKRQADGRYGVGGGKAERAAWLANPLGAGRKRVRSEKLGGTPKALGQSPC